MKNTYIWFEEYGASMGMNSNGRMSMDERGHMDGSWQMLDETIIDGDGQ